MSIPIVSHTSFHWRRDQPSPERPITMAGRDLRATAMLAPHSHDWGQFTYALQGVMRVDANHSSWLVPPQRAIWIPPGAVHAVTVLKTPICGECR